MDPLVIIGLVAAAVGGVADSIRQRRKSGAEGNDGRESQVLLDRIEGLTNQLAEERTKSAVLADEVACLTARLKVMGVERDAQDARIASLEAQLDLVVRLLQERVD